MALIKTIVEIRAVLPRISNLSSTSLLPNIDKAEWKYIRPILGRNLEDSLNDKYNAEPRTLTPLEAKLLKHIQLPLAAFALYDDLAFIHATITDNGIRTASTASMATAHRWEFNELKNALYDTALDGLEILLDFLFSNKADFDLWTASEEYRRLDNFLIKDSIDFSRQYRLYQPQRTFFQLQSIMQDVEENYIISMIGRDLLEFVKSLATIETTAAGSIIDVKKLLKKAVAFFTISTACDHMTVQFSSNGFSVLAGNPEDDSAGRTTADSVSINTKKEAANREGQNYLAKAAYYLSGMYEGVFPHTYLEAFTSAFALSPLWYDPTIERPLVTNGNPFRRGVFII